MLGSLPRTAVHCVMIVATAKPERSADYRAPDGV